MHHSRPTSPLPHGPRIQRHQTIYNILTSFATFVACTYLPPHIIKTYRWSITFTYQILYQFGTKNSYVPPDLQQRLGTCMQQKIHVSSIYVPVDSLENTYRQAQLRHRANYLRTSMVNMNQEFNTTPKYAYINVQYTQVTSSSGFGVCLHTRWDQLYGILKQISRYPKLDASAH